MERWQSINHGVGEFFISEKRLSLDEIVGHSIAQPKWVDAVHITEAPKNYATPFLVHLTSSLLDILFVNEGKYKHRHVPSVVGLYLDGDTIDGYLMQHVKGNEGFPWDPWNLQLSEWIPFVSVFGVTGIPMGYDVADVDYGHVAQNILLDGWNISDSIQNRALPPSWYRIDYGYLSCRVNWETMSRFLGENSDRIRKALGPMADVLALAHHAGSGRESALKVNALYHKVLREYPKNLFAAQEVLV